MRAFKTKRNCRTRTIAVLGLASLLLPAAALAAGGDFDGDGFADLAVGVPNEGVGVHGAGAVNVIYGRGSGLDGAGSQIWHQSLGGILDGAEFNDHFGSSLAVGDFNGDGYDDLAVGVPGESLGGFARAGAVNVIYGSAAGLTDTGNQLWSQATVGILGVPETDDAFGWSLAAGDFNHDGYEDLAVGVPGDDVGFVLHAGAVNVIYGSPAGLAVAGNQLWTQDVPGVLDFAEEGDGFGYALAAGDYNGDLISDLAIGVWSEDLTTGGGVPIVDAGAVNVLYSDWSGLIVEGNQLWHQNVRGVHGDTVQGIAEDGDRFGASLAAGDFNGDSYSDLAVGSPHDNLARIVNAGAVNVIYGFHEGLIIDGNQHWNQDRVEILGEAETDDAFGASVAAGDFDGDGYDELAIGIPHDTVRGRFGAGAVAVLRGTETGLTRSDNQIWSQSSNGIREKSELWDQFGSALATGDFDGNGRDDLAVGVFNESVGRVNGGGAVNVLYGRAIGLREVGTQLWTQNSPGIPNRSEHVDQFGFALASR